jgi:hypothetical protein
VAQRRRNALLLMSLLSLLSLMPSALSAQNARPAVAGVTLGMSAEAVRRAVGRPELEQVSLGMRFWEYRRRGITLIWREDVPVVHGVVVSSPEAGAVDGVRVGDPATELRVHWGPPARVRVDGRFHDFTRRTWTVSAEVADGRVVEITLLAAR